MLMIKSKVYEDDLPNRSPLEDDITKDLNKHPDWQIIQITETVIPKEFGYKWNGAIHRYTVFYREEE